ncbi:MULTISPECIES: SecY-interacting protein [Yersinia pseudotuberculosis complex]|uniref:SecY-interacting protein n=1 Tax=Yersinia pseudotuberculosis complex TaxID=1649845 RepID=UPI00042594B1|nr:MULTISPECIES: SecY-interacting protein [Yersinia pseudotuberculosis complex]CNF74222.1 SecY interacting protein Syd [Yersinia pseudotuberculosis]CNL06264.1 SecY interacting protein Syd [Yersinia pseudotuberculosis]
MDLNISTALRSFTQRYIDLWQQQTGHLPASKELYGVPSPCIVETGEDQVFWQPQAFLPKATLTNIERALEIQLHPDIHDFYTQQYAGDMMADLGNHRFTLLQVWSEDDFIRLQENLIGHLVTQKRLKLSPTLFLATTSSEMTMASLCNVSGNVVLEQFGSDKRTLLASTLSHFLDALRPVLPE